jgi:hypothetical protein
MGKERGILETKTRRKILLLGLVFLGLQSVAFLLILNCGLADGI